MQAAIDFVFIPVFRVGIKKIFRYINDRENVSTEKNIPHKPSEALDNRGVLNFYLQNKNIMETALTGRNVNVGNVERILSTFAGSQLLIKLVRRRRFNIVDAITGGFLVYRGVTGHCPVYSAMGKQPVTHPNNVNLRTEIYVAKPKAEVYTIWRKLENLPSFMKHLESVKEVYDNIWEWKANIPGKLVPVKWRACIIKDIYGETISWRSLPDSMVDNTGKIEFRSAEGGMGTVVHVTISYKPPMGVIGNTVAEFFNPSLEKLVANDVYDFKKYAESQS